MDDCVTIPRPGHDKILINHKPWRDRLVNDTVPYLWLLMRGDLSGGRFRRFSVTGDRPTGSVLQGETWRPQDNDTTICQRPPCPGQGTAPRGWAIEGAAVQ